LSTPDTSVVVAAFGPWHESHLLAVDAISRRTRLIGHVALETYSVLTRLPAPHRAPPDVVVEFLRQNFTREPLVLPPSAYMGLLGGLPRRGIAGGSVYDAVVAATAAHAGERLLTLDLRALPTYQALEAVVEVLE
jgi:predicted nucleic acid-binding protein